MIEPYLAFAVQSKTYGCTSRSDIVFTRKVADIMTRKVMLGQPRDDLISVFHTMTEKRIRHLPVMDQGRLVGIVSMGDVVKAQCDRYQGEVDTLQTQILGDQPARKR